MFRINRKDGERIVVAGPCVVEIKRIGYSTVEVCVDASDDVRIARAEELDSQLGRRATAADVCRLAPRREPT